MIKKLTTCSVGLAYQVTEILGLDDAKHFFSHVGLRINDKITLVNIINKHYIIYFKGARFAMEEVLAACLMVKKI